VVAREAPESGPRDVFCYFDNTDVKLRAPADAQALMRKLGIIRDKAGQRVVGEPIDTSATLRSATAKLPRVQAARIVSGFLGREAKRSTQR
jgi:hypothetical protein